MKPVLFMWILFVSFICPFSFLAQNISIESGSTYAVVVGISDYHNERIPDLQFAHEDAIAFANYLKSPSGGSIEEDQIKLLLNQEATVGQMYAAFDWLIEHCKKGDRAIIYFSGHGDVETNTRKQAGFLLAYDTPPHNYRAGAFAIYFLQDIIETLDFDNKVQVILINDACRAGKLAGASYGGPGATTAALSYQYAHEIKILSCQPDEFSLEGEQWGGGCFSYHLLNGLYGLADKNRDLNISLLELERYLSEKVPEEAAPHSQIPMAFGNKSTRLTTVVKTKLDQLQAQEEKEEATISLIKSKTIKNLVLEIADSNILRLYQDFMIAIDKGHLLNTPDGSKSADELYMRLSKEPSMEKMYGLMKRNFAAALQDSAQLAINALLTADRDYLVGRWFVKEKYPYPRYLHRATELLGPDHYLYATLKANQHYFEAWNLIFSLNGKKIAQDSLKLIESLNKFHLALSLSPQAAYLHEGLARVYKYKQVLAIDSAIVSLQRAITLAPSWAIPYYEMAGIFFDKKDLETAELWYQKSITVDSTFFGAYNKLAYIYRRQKQPEKAVHILRKALQIDSTDYYSYFSLAAALMYQKKYEEAIQVYLNLAPYLPDKVKVITKYNIDLLDIYLYVGYLEKAKSLCMKMLEMKRDSAVAYAGLGFVDLYRGNHNTAWDQFTIAAKLSNETYYTHLNFASYYAMTGKLDKALEWMELALKKGNQDYHWISTSISFDPLRKLPAFKKLMQKYFPKRYIQN